MPSTEFQDQDIWPAVRQEIIKTADNYALKMQSGMCKTMDSYTHAVGYHQALMFVLGIPKSLADDTRKKTETETTKEDSF